MSRYFTVNRIALMSILIALTHIGRLSFQFIPNIQPVTTLLIIISLTIGPVEGAIIAVLSILLSNLFLGMGPWAFTQMISYIVIMIITGCLRPVYAKMDKNPVSRRVIFSLYAGLTGLLYGFIISVLSAYLLDIQNFWVYYLQGATFDFMHTVGNIAFFLVLEPVLVPLIMKQLKK